MFGPEWRRSTNSGGGRDYNSDSKWTSRGLPGTPVVTLVEMPGEKVYFTPP